MTRWVDLPQEIPGLRGARIHVLPAGKEALVREHLARHGFEIRVLEGVRARGEAAFFEEVARALELPSWFGANWDALNDCLSELAEGEARRVAVLWRDAHLSLGGDVQTVLSAVLAFEAAAACEAAEDEDPLQLVVFLLGNGSGFGGGEPA